MENLEIKNIERAVCQETIKKPIEDNVHNSEEELSESERKRLFDEVGSYIMKKNAELYRRLA